MRMQGHGHQIGDMNDLMEALAEALAKAGAMPERTQEEFVQESIERIENEMRTLDVSLTVLRGEPPEPGALLVALDALKPRQPELHGAVTIATYVLPSGAYLVVGTDHLTQAKVSHSTPNKKGVTGLQEAVAEEMAKMADAMTPQG